jgi:hypothetical protein
VPVKFWPFAIAAGKHEDFDFVVLPDVIPDRSRDFWRVPVFRANEAADEIRIFETQIDGHKASCVYRTMAIEEQSEAVLDTAGRPVFKSVGFLTFDAIGNDGSRWLNTVMATEFECREVIERFVNHKSPPSPGWKPLISTVQPSEIKRQNPEVKRRHPEPGSRQTKLVPPVKEWRIPLLNRPTSRFVLICSLITSVLLNLVQLGYMTSVYFDKREIIGRLHSVSLQREKLSKQLEDLQKRDPNADANVPY